MKFAPRSLLALCTLSAISAGLGACYTSAATGDELLRRVGDLESGQAAQREELRTEIATAQTKVGELEQVLQQATKVVTRASADTGAQVETLQGQVQALEGQLAELRNEVTRQQAEMAEQQAEFSRQLKRVAQKVGIDMSLDESEIPAGADPHFTAAEQAYNAREFSRARALYRAFIERHGRDERVDNARFRVGRSYLEEERPATALAELRHVVREHANGDVVDDSLLAMAEAFYALHRCDSAQGALRALLRNHRRSPLRRQAQQLQRRVQRAPRGYCQN